MLYHYIASDKSGKVVEADVEANNLAGVLQYISVHELRPVSVKPVVEKRAGLRMLFGKITLVDKVFLTKYLALMLRVGTDLLSAINILIADFDKPAMKSLLLEVRDNLSRGQPFYEVFERHPDTFSPTFVNLVKAAENSGNLQQTFEDLSKSMAQEADLRGRVRAALIYPVVLLSMSFAIFTFLATFALPKIAKVFADSGVDPPLFSKIVFSVGLYFGAHFLPITALLIGGAGFLYYFFSKTETGKRMLDQLLTHLPVVKKIYREIAVQRFASTVSSLMRAGLPIVQTINVAADTVGLSEFRFALLRVGNEGLAKGLTLGEAFKRETVFPRVMTNLIAISEKAGHIEEVLQTLSDFYAANVEASLRSAVGLLEPILLLAMGGLVATIALSIIIPIYQLTTQF